MRESHPLMCFGLLLAAFALVLTPLRAAQEPAPRPAFGSSLSRLKWDEKKKRMTEEAPPTATTKKNEDTDNVLRVETDLAVFDVLVLDPQGKMVSGLTPPDFLVKEDGQPQEVASFSLGDGSKIARSIVLVIDYSGSQLPYIQNSIAAAKTLVDKLKPKDRMAIVTDDVALLADFTSDKNQLKAALDQLGQPKTIGRSAQYSALFATLRELVDGEERPIIIFQTDGDELPNLRGGAKLNFNGPLPPFMESRLKPYSLEDIYTRAEKSRTTIYSVIPGTRYIDIPPAEQLKRAKLELEKRMEARAKAGAFPPPPNATQLRQRPESYFQAYVGSQLRQQLVLASLAKLTGGWADYLEEPQQANAIYTRILAGIEKRYILGYYPTNETRNGKLRKVEIKIRDHADYTVWGKKSYYAPTP